MTNLDELFELFKEYAELGTAIQDQLLAVAVEGEDVSDQNEKAMEKALDFINRVHRFFNEVDQDDIVGDLDCLASTVEHGLDDLDSDDKADTDDEEFSEED